jgi:hypothetical protein
MMEDLVLHVRSFMRVLKSSGWVVGVVAVATLALGVTGCSSSSAGAAAGGDAGGVDSGGNDDGGSDSSSADGAAAVQACAAEATAICNLRSSCSMTFAINKNFPDLATCVSRTEQTCVASLAANGTAQTPAGITSCGAAYPTEACSDYFDDNPVAACTPPSGTLQTGLLAEPPVSARARIARCPSIRSVARASRFPWRGPRVRWTPTAVET